MKNDVKIHIRVPNDYDKTIIVTPMQLKNAMWVADNNTRMMRIPAEKNYGKTKIF